MSRMIVGLALLLMGCPSSSPPQPEVQQDAGDLLEVRTKGELEPQEIAGDLSSKCPPAPPYGLNLGQRVEPLVFLDASGEPRSLHDFCGQELTLVYHYYGW